MKKVIWGTILLLFLAGCGSSVTSDSTQGSSSISTNESTISQSSESAKDILSKDDLMNKVFVGKATSKDGSKVDYSISFNALVPPEVDFKGDVLNTQISGYGNEFFERMNIEPKSDSYLVTAYNIGSTSNSPDVSLDIKKNGSDDISFSNNDLDVEASYDEEYTKSVQNVQPLYSFKDNTLKTPKYTLKINSYQVIQSPSEKNPGLNIVFEFTNNSNEPLAFLDTDTNIELTQTTETSLVTLSDRYFDNDAFSDNEEEAKVQDKLFDNSVDEVLPGKTVDVSESYELRDSTLPVTITAVDSEGNKVGETTIDLK